MNVAPNDVRKAVSSDALSTPCALPSGSMIVTIPFGVVLCALAIDEGGWKESPEIEERESVVLIVEAGLNFSPSTPDIAELIEDFLLGSFTLSDLGDCVLSNVTTFMPTDLPVDAGRNTDVAVFRFSTVCSGWKLAQHAALVSPVEYS